MALFTKQQFHGDNRIENAGRWPVRLTHFHLTDDYSFPATNYPEIFFVQQGGLLHETKNGKQTIREGFVILVHPGHQHAISNPDNVIISRIRFLPEWFTMDYSAIIAMPDVLTLFFDQISIWVCGIGRACAQNCHIGRHVYHNFNSLGRSGPFIAISNIGFPWLTQGCWRSIHLHRQVATGRKLQSKIQSCGIST